MGNQIQRRDFLKGASGLAAAAAWSGALSTVQAADAGGDKPLRLGVIGPGGTDSKPGTARGQNLMATYLKIPGISVVAICDVLESCAKEAADNARKMQGFAPELYTRGPWDYRRMLERDDIDALIVTSPAQWHARMAVDAMNAGKHVATEVPGGYAMDDLWELVEARERTGKVYMLLENYIYRRNDLAILNMCQQGALGDTFYAECGYIHELRWIAYHPDGRPTWRIDWFTSMPGNSYPTHAIGPVAKWMNINDGDRFEYCTAMRTQAGVMDAHCREKYGPDSIQAQTKHDAGELFTTLIHTAKGKVIRCDMDMTSSRPHIYTGWIEGVKGTVNGNGEGLTDELKAKYDHVYWKRDGEEAAKYGHGGGDFFVIRDFFNAVRTGREPWIDVYDSATWSSLYECSRQSIANRGAPVDFPDFTRGRWKDADWRKDSLKPV